MSTAVMNLDQNQIVYRIDAIIRELLDLRGQLTVTPKPTAAPARSLTDELFGAAGQGKRDEYDLQLDWVRFSE
jgi:hypothetical protein